MPPLISAAIGTFITSHVLRLNYERIITPSLLLHLGAGYMDLYFSDNVVNLNYNSQQQLGLKGATVNRMFPAFTNASNAQGGVKNLGPTGNRNIWYQKPTFNQSLTWVQEQPYFQIRGGGAVRRRSDASLYGNQRRIQLQCGGNSAALPQHDVSERRHGGFPYASFLLGLVDSGIDRQSADGARGAKRLGIFCAGQLEGYSRKLTLDYGLRYDYQGYPREQYGRYPDFSPTTPNPSAGGLPGAVIFEGGGPGHCNCSFGKMYPYAFGPRLGAAYQINPQDSVSGRLWRRLFRHADQQPDNNFHLHSRVRSVRRPSGSPR